MTRSSKNCEIIPNCDFNKNFFNKIYRYIENIQYYSLLYKNNTSIKINLIEEEEDKNNQSNDSKDEIKKEKQNLENEKYNNEIIDVNSEKNNNKLNINKEEFTETDSVNNNKEGDEKEQKNKIKIKRKEKVISVIKKMTGEKIDLDTKNKEKNQNNLNNNENFKYGNFIDSMGLDIKKLFEIQSLNDLKNNLQPKENLKDYFQRMLKYYNKSKYKKNYYLYDLANKDYFSLEDKFIFKIDYDNLPFVSNMFKFLKEQLKPVIGENNKEIFKEYQGNQSFGFLIYNNMEYFYVFKNEYNQNLFDDINRVKEYGLDDDLIIPSS